MINPASLSSSLSLSSVDVSGFRGGQMNFGNGHGQGGGSKIMMDQLKSTLLTLFMVNSMGRAQNGGPSTTSSDMLMMVYVFVVTQIVEIFMQYVPLMFEQAQRRFFDTVTKPIKQSSPIVFNSNTDETGRRRTKTSSIILHISVSDVQNTLGQALLEFITHHTNTKHIKYMNRSFILNEKAVIDVGDDVLMVMTDDEMNQDSGTESNRNGGEKSDHQSSHRPSSTGTTNGGKDHIQTYEVFSYVKTTKELRDFLRRLERNYRIALNNQFGFKRFYFDLISQSAPKIPGPKKDLTVKDYSRLPPQFTFNMKEFHTNRKFSNLFGDDVEKIRERVNFFVNNKKWYEEKGVPYTLGLLISGPPGTGKTSIIKCLAKETNRNVVNINFNNDISKAQLEHLFFSDVINVNNPFAGKRETYNVPLDERIIVLEDADCQADILRKRVVPPPTTTPLIETQQQQQQQNTNPSTNRSIGFDLTDFPQGMGGGGLSYATLDAPMYEETTSQETHKVDLSFLLNLLDGVLEMPGRIIIMTSNHPEILDDALVRPGRIDVIAKFRNCTHATLMQMFEFFYSTELTTEQCDIIKSTKEFLISPARVSQLMFENFGDIDGGLRAVTRWCQENPW